MKFSTGWITLLLAHLCFMGLIFPIMVAILQHIAWPLILLVPYIILLIGAVLTAEKE